MRRCDIMQCYYNHDGRCAIGSFVKNDKGEWTKAPKFCPNSTAEKEEKI